MKPTSKPGPFATWLFVMMLGTAFNVGLRLFGATESAEHEPVGLTIYLSLVAVLSIEWAVNRICQAIEGARR